MQWFRLTLCLQDPIDIGSNPTIEFFSSDEESIYKLEIKELTFDPGSIDKAKLQGKKLAEIDTSIWNYIWETKDTFSQDTSFLTQSTQGASSQRDRGFPQHKLHNNLYQDIKESSSFPLCGNKTKSKSTDVFDVNGQYHTGDDDNDEDNDDDNGDGESEDGSNAESLGAYSHGHSDEGERSVYDDDPIVWRLPNGQDAHYDVLEVDQAMEALRGVQLAWTQAPIQDRDRSFYKQQDKTIVENTKILLEQEQMPSIVFEEWHQLASYFISSNYLQTSLRIRLIRLTALI